MKSIKFLTAILFITLSTVTFAAGNKTEAIKVSGNCDMCKTTIEKAAKTNGVSKAIWDKKTKVLTVVYNPEKVTSDDIQKKVAAVGYDTPKFKAPDKAYNTLHSCCKYR